MEKGCQFVITYISCQKSKLVFHANNLSILNRTYLGKYAFKWKNFVNL